MIRRSYSTSKKTLKFRSLEKWYTFVLPSDRSEVSWDGPESSCLFAFSAIAAHFLGEKKRGRAEKQRPGYPGELRIPCLLLCCPAKSTWWNLAACQFLTGSDTHQLMPCGATQGKGNPDTFTSFPPLHLEAGSNAGDCSVLQHWPNSISFHSSATASWQGGMNYLDLCKREGWEGTRGRIANALPMLQSCSRLQSAAGTGKCDHQTLERSFWSVLHCCRRQAIQPSPSSVSCLLCRGNKLPGWLQKGNVLDSSD